MGGVGELAGRRAEINIEEDAGGDSVCGDLAAVARDGDDEVLPR